MRRNSACPSCTLITTVDLALILNFKYNASKKNWIFKRGDMQTHLSYFTWSTEQTDVWNVFISTYTGVTDFKNRPYKIIWYMYSVSQKHATLHSRL